MTFLSLYSKKLLTTRQKVILYGAMCVCTIAFFYTYFAVEYVSNIMLISMADASPHVRIFLNENCDGNALLGSLKMNPEVTSADLAIFGEADLLVITREREEKIGEEGKIYYRGKQKVQIIGYPFDFYGYKPPFNIDNVYSSVNKERLSRSPSDDPCLIITDPNEDERLNWVVLNRKGMDYMPDGPSKPFRSSCMELLTKNSNQKTVVSYSGFFLNNPLSVTRQENIPLQIITKKTTALKIGGDEIKWIPVLDVSLKNRLHADHFANMIAKEYKFKTQSWIELNESSLPFLRGIKIIAYIGISSILLLSAIGIGTLLLLLLQEKTRQFAIIQAIGIKPLSLRMIFVRICLKAAIFSILIGGCIGSFFACLSLPYWEHLMRNFCTKTTTYLFYTPQHIYLYAGIFVLISSITAWLPSRQIAQSDPIKHLRNE